MQVRLRRLSGDRDRLRAFAERCEFIKILSMEGDPPEKYVIEYWVRGLTMSKDGEPEIATTHRAEVILPLDYPRRPPFCRMLTPVFHPNISPQKICIGDHWSAGQSLLQLIVHISEMISFQSYNLKSPLNAEAAEWTRKNTTSLPLDSVDLYAAI